MEIKKILCVHDQEDHEIAANLAIYSHEFAGYILQKITQYNFPFYM